MAELQFSTIHNDPLDLRAIRQLLDAFEQERRVHVRLIPMDRNSAWTDLMSIASTGKGPDVSHVGSTWISSLVAMDAVRPFQAREVGRLGPQQVFLPPAWQSAHLTDEVQIWSAPWNTFLFTVFYRRDLLEQAGIDENTAFGRADALLQTIARLKEKGSAIPWLIPYSPPPYDGLLHMAASWVWAAGGEFVSRDGRRVILDQPPAIEGLVNWLMSECDVPRGFHNLTDDRCIELLREGQCTAILSNVRIASLLCQRVAGTSERERLGFAVLTQTPWCGGDNLIIWQHTRGDPERQAIALDLVEFLASPRAQIRLAQQAHLIPSRRDAMQEVYPPGHPLNPLMEQVIARGRAYTPIRLWHRIEFHLAQIMGALLNEVSQGDTRPTEALVRRHVVPMVERLNLILGN